VRFSASREIGGLATTDPLDPERVQRQAYERLDQLTTELLLGVR